jgi:AMP deaminase
MNVSLSTDDPLQFHYTKEPLIEEYSVAAQIYKLSSADMCEIAKYSVLQSGYEATVKRQWIGSQFHKDCISSNDVNKTNVPHRRALFRYSILQKEKAILRGQEGVPDELVHSTAIPDNEQLMLKEVEAGISMPEKLCPNCTT